MMSNQYQVYISPDFDEKYPGASALATETAMNLVRTAELLVKRIADLVQPFELTPSSGLVLGILVDEGVPLPPNQIAQRLILSRASVTSLLDSLEKRGYIRRKPHPTDRRMLHIELTDPGREVAHEFRSLVHRNQNAWLSVISEEDQASLIDAFHRLQSALIETRAATPD